MDRFIKRYAHDEDKWVELAEGMKVDLRGKELGSGEIPTRLEEWATHKSVVNRGVYAA